MADRPLSASGGQRVVGRYALHGELASGGMATVYLGRLLGPVGFSRTVAVKALHAQYAKDPDFVRMFLDEARLVSRIHHPNVVPVLDIVAEKSELLLVMEYVQGESLSRLLRTTVSRGGRVAPPIAVAIVSGVLHGLHAAHEATNEQGEPLGIVHRDVSPQNVIVSVDGVARVLDFGIARAAGRLHHTQDGTLKGKLAYMAPEQLLNEGATRRTDVYAAAVVLWETLTAKRLFAADSQGSLVHQVLHGAVRPPSELVDGLPAGLDRIALRGLEREPAKRFETAREMALALDECLPPATAPRVGAWVTDCAGEALAERSARVASIESGSVTPSVRGMERAIAELMPPPSGPTKVDSPPVRAPSEDAGSPTEVPVSGRLRVPSTPASAPVHQKRRLAAALLFGLAVLVVAGVRLARVAGTAGGSPSAASTSGDAAAAPGPTAITSLALPTTTNRDALAAYVAGLQAMRDDNWDRANGDFARAAALDPGMALAELRLAMVSWGSLDPIAAREHFGKAVALRGQLGERDQTLLEALDPLVLRMPSDLADAEGRLVAATARFPLDAELFDWLAFVRQGNPVASLAAASRAAELDDKDAQALESKGHALQLLGKADEADATLERCASLSLETTDCLIWKQYGDAVEGRCADLERDARRVIEREPKSSLSYLLLASAMLAQGRPLAVVRETFAQGESFQADPLLDYWAAWPSIATGDLDRARSLARDSLRKIGSTMAYNAHYFATLAFVQAALETGHAAEAQDAAAEFVARSPAWASAQGVNLGADKSPWLMRLAANAGKITDADFEARRKEWIEARLKVSRVYRGLVWTYAYAAAAETRAQAEEALAKLPEYAPLTSYDRAWVGIPDAEIGHVRFLAGQLDDAIESLERAVAHCNLLEWSYEHVRAAAELGQAFEQKGDKAKACAAYKKVTDAWGSAKAASVTATRVGARAKALGCGSEAQNR